MICAKKSALPMSFIFFISAFSLFAQEALKSTEEEYYDFLSLIGAAERPTLNYRTLSDSEWKVFDDEKNIWAENNLGAKYILFAQETGTENWFSRGIDKSIKLKLYGPEWFSSYNSAAPYGQNDGALWQGKGYNTSITAGARLEAYGFELTIKPQVSFSENREFDFMPGVYGSEYSYFWSGNIDLVQRYGDSSFWTYDWGDTEARWTWNNFTIGAGFQSPWLGPAWLNPMLGSNNAATYPKFDIGLRKTQIRLPWLGWYIGDIEGRVWGGYLTESDYFDNDDSNDNRMLNAISISYAPSFIKGFSLGVNRIFITKWKTENLKYIGRLFTLSHDNDVYGDGEDQKVSIFADWRFEKIGFEVFGEFGIDDFSSQKTANPFHTAIYTVGAKQYIPLPFSKINPSFMDLKSEFILEWNNFEMSQDFQLQWAYMGYYAHGLIKQGYTQKGQILGAGSGFFGNSQFFGYKIYFPKGYIMPYFHRSSPDNNYIYSKAVYADASKNASNSGKNTISDDYWAIFKTYKEIGGELAFFVTKSLLLDSSFSCIWINFPTYDKEKIGERSYYFTLKVKYNF